MQCGIRTAWLPAGLACVLLFFGASTAGAFALEMRLNPGSVAPSQWFLFPSDVVILDVYLDADPGLGFLSVAVAWDDHGTLVYARGQSSMPSYILYTPGAGTQTPTYMIPNVDPPLYWPGQNIPGKRQVNVDYLEPSFGSATATGSDIWIATLVFHSTGFGTTRFELTLDAAGTIVEAYTNDVKGLTSTSGTLVPEPNVGLLIGLGLSAAGLTRSPPSRPDESD